MKRQMDGKVFFSPELALSFVNIMIEVLFSIRTLKRRENNYVSRQGKGLNRRNESTIIFI